jgi:hypothetical protein
MFDVKMYELKMSTIRSSKAACKEHTKTEFDLAHVEKDAQMQIAMAS